VGDPTEIALLQVGALGGIFRRELLDSLPEVREEAFDPKLKMMATVHNTNGRYLIAVKGAPEAVLAACTHVQTPGGDKPMSERARRRWLEHNDRMAEQGLRLLAFATQDADSPDADPYDGLAFLGLYGLQDPPRHAIKHAIDSCRDAGIGVIMVTGDQPLTARAVGTALGFADDGDPAVVEGKDIQDPEGLSAPARKNLLQASIFARVSPEQKLDLVALHQANEAVVAMTGDGVNDAPALKKADIGIAMGQRGTQVAREAADMVLKDDNFTSIVTAVEEGRAIFENIRKFVLYLLSGNVGEIIIVGLAIAIGAPLPLLPLQILYLNMIGDVFPALALGVGKGDPSHMQQPPRHVTESILTDRHWLAVGGYGLLIAVTVLGAFGLAFHWLHVEKGYAVTIAFLTLAFGRLWHVFNMRRRGSRFFRNEITRNPSVWGALALCCGLLIMAVYLPGLAAVLELATPSREGWLLIIGASMIPWAVGQGFKSVKLQKRG